MSKACPECKRDDVPMVFSVEWGTTCSDCYDALEARWERDQQTKTNMAREGEENQ